jgi:hypothetical protein
MQCILCGDRHLWSCCSRRSENEADSSDERYPNSEILVLVRNASSSMYRTQYHYTKPPNTTHTSTLLNNCYPRTHSIHLSHNIQQTTILFDTPHGQNKYLYYHFPNSHSITPLYQNHATITFYFEIIDTYINIISNLLPTMKLCLGSQRTTIT